ncbi:MAG: hypothetical protein Q8910_12485 [Bacteroidota bacterium]|nr:hypothetical protein [Bacteroidota bacterium]
MKVYVRPDNIELHYTNEQMVKDLISITPICGSVLDAGSGKNKVWFNNLSGEKYECEIEDGVNFYDWDKKMNWVVGNPPFSHSWAFTEKAITIATDGIAFLVNNMGLNSQTTPRRLQIMKDAGFELQHIRVVSDKRWFGRYYFIIFEKKKGFLSWERKTY